MQRSRKIVFVSHPVLNQNAAPATKGYSPGAVKEVMEILGEAGVGIVQLPCIETEHFGLDRKPKIKEDLDSKPYRTACKKMAQEIIKTIINYKEKKYSVVGILGLEFSPTYAVHQLENGHRNTPGKGILMEELELELAKKRMQIPFVGVNPNNPNSSAQKIRQLMQFSS